jgi:archaellum component FlaC
MSDSQQYEVVSVSSDGVTVDKRFEEDEFPVPAIAFEISSTRAETVTIRLVDQVPEGVETEDLGFHPEYGSEFWTLEDDQITFERELEANSEYTTVYGIRATGTDNVEQFLTEPTIESVDPPLDGDDVVVNEESSDVVRDVISGDGEIPGLEDDEGETGDEDDEDVETLDLKDPNEPADTGGESASGDGGAAVADLDAETLTGALATEIRNGNVSEDDVKLLRKAFDMADDDSSASVEARIKRLQTEVSDLLAYTDALETFLDENGTGDELIEDFDDRIDEFESRIEGFQSDLDEVREYAEDHDETLNSLESDVESVQQTMSSLESDVASVGEDVESITEDLESVESEVESVSAELDDLEGQVGDIDVENVKSDIDEIESEIEDLKEWREQLSSVIGG